MRNKMLLILIMSVLLNGIAGASDFESLVKAAEANTNPPTLPRPWPKDVPSTSTLEIMIHNLIERHGAVPAPGDKPAVYPPLVKIESVLVLAVFADGAIYCSQDRVNGGGAFYKGKIDPALIAPIKEHIIQTMAQGLKLGSAPHIDSSYLTVRANGKYLSSQTYHFLIEANHPDYKNLEKGVFKKGAQLEPRTIKEKEYALYKTRWEQMRAAALSLVPQGELTKVDNLDLQGVLLHTNKGR